MTQAETGAMSPRISINCLSLAAGSLADHAGAVARLGAAAISPDLAQVEELGTAAAARLLRDSGLAVATLTHRAFAFATADEAAEGRQRLDRTIAMAAGIGAQSVTFTSGGRGALSWSEACDRFAQAIASSAGKARDAGVALSLEPTSHLYADASIAHRLADLVTLCARAGIGLGIDTFACWFDSDIDEAVAAAVPLCRIVQVSDYVAGDRALPCRAVPGDGIAGLERLVPAIERAGYTGYYDLELIGPRIAAEGHEAALRRGAAFLETLLAG